MEKNVMITKKRTIGLLLICLLTVGIASVYAQSGNNPLNEVWDTITTLMSRIAALETRVDVLEAECPPGIGPSYTLRIDTRDIVLEGGVFEVWSYVKNPSLTIERGDEGPLHNVEVLHLTMTWIDPVGETVWVRFYPNGDYEDSDVPGETFNFPEMALRWDSTVHPGETALVFYSGWVHSPDYGSVPGIYQYTYELNVEYEGTLYDLAKTFDINVQE
ncbi:hypothetical protein ES703_69071 [subsurface metagenome]